MGILSAVIATVSDVRSLFLFLFDLEVWLADLGVLDWYGGSDIHLCGVVYLHGGHCCYLSFRTVWKEKLLMKVFRTYQLHGT
jgi:hypothetical protein